MRTFARSERIDICDDDLHARLQLRDEITAARIQRRLSRADLAELLQVAKPTIYKFEKAQRANFALQTFTKYAAAVGRSLVLDPVDVPDYADTEDAAILDLIGGDAYAHAAVMDRLFAARRNAAWLVRQLALSLGVTPQAIHGLEALERDSQWLSNIQRYTRGLGGRLELVLVSIEAELVAA